MAKPPTIAIPLDLSDVMVTSTTVTKDHTLLIEVESTRPTTMCQRCGQEISQFHGYDRPLTLRHLPVLGMPVFIRIRPKRFRCPFCDDHPTTTQRLAWYEPNATATTAFVKHLLMQLVHSTIADVASKEGVSEEVVAGVVMRWIETTVDWVSLPPFAILGIDEIALKKGHKHYVALLTARTSTGEIYLLAVLPDRKKETVVAWLQQIPADRKVAITRVCSDMWEGYVSAVEEVLPEALIVIDRFHVAQHYHKAADALRKQEVKRLHAELPKAVAAQLKHTMWPFRKRKADLDDAEAEALKRLLKLSPALLRAYELREGLRKIFETATSKVVGVRRIKAWIQRVRVSGLDCFDDVLGTLERWLGYIANYFHERQTSGFVEGLNNKIKVLKRRCFGIVKPTSLFQRITLDLHGYRRFGRSGLVPVP